ncbi:YqaA family protein [Marinoscillum furvescens]|uniref:SNARE associated Golgi protein n=1 Tax=Marinoscillum furvescens DSM 4134 TaxID=1122208 RepID=A0A3D9L7E5_MARFU|nr:VTT domain-containing protein [Marinoscillum furvescens]REE00417.1 SNARE associated Golgi protein [Marinoscillum furvescens DSM 4134]
MQPDEQREAIERTRFFLRNFLKGVIWLAVIVGGYFYLKANYNFTMQGLLGPLYDQPALIFSIFFASETIFGIIPPELFMIWALRNELLSQYILNVIGLAVISYMSGIIGYYIGSHFSTTQLYRTLQKNYLGKFEKHFNRFGGFLVIVAALTPLPFSGICMLMGTVKYPYRRFLLFSLTRFLRFIVYAAIIWEANILQ